MPDNCPHCGAALAETRNRGRLLPVVRIWKCGTSQAEGDEVRQSPKCRIAELEAEVKRLRPVLSTARRLRQTTQAAVRPFVRDGVFAQSTLAMADQFGAAYEDLRAATDAADEKSEPPEPV